MNDPNRNDDNAEGDSSPTPDKGNILLEEFRQQWRKELKTGESAVVLSNNDVDNESSQKIDEDKAKSLFTEAVELEKLGKVFEAMNLYRKAVQIVPDIEFRIYDSSTNQTKPPKPERMTDDQLNANFSECDKDDEDLDGVDLMERFQLAVGKSGCLFSRNADAGVITTGLHFSDLPLEIIFYILRWVVSSELDMRSLVSRGFYVCAKDPDIWKLACLKIWGISTGDLNVYPSWRQMFLHRHRVHFNGCYISKASYLRYGENSFQDQFYRPVQIIEYYRYLRFFSDGSILMMTSADGPAQSVPKLKNKNPRNDVLKGHYRLHDDVVIIVLKRNKTAQHQYYKQQRRSSVIDDSTSSIQSFYLELNIASTNSSKRQFNQLKWKHYASTPRDFGPDDDATGLHAEIETMKEDFAMLKVDHINRMEALRQRLNEPTDVADVQNYADRLKEEQDSLQQINFSIVKARRDIEGFQLEKRAMSLEKDSKTLYIRSKAEFDKNRTEINVHKKTIKENNADIQKFKERKDKLQMEIDRLQSDIEDMKYKTIKTVMRAQQEGIDWTIIDCTTPNILQNIRNGTFVNPQDITILFDDMTDTSDENKIYGRKEWYNLLRLAKTARESAQTKLDESERKKNEHNQKIIDLKQDLDVAFNNFNNTMTQILNNIANDSYIFDDMELEFLFQYDNLKRTSEMIFVKENDLAIGFDCLPIEHQASAYWLLFAALNQYSKAPFAFIDLLDVTKGIIGHVAPIVDQIATKTQLFIISSHVHHLGFANLQFGINDTNILGRRLTRIFKHVSTEHVNPVPPNDGVPPTDPGAAADPRNDGVEGMPPTDPVEGVIPRNDGVPPTDPGAAADPRNDGVEGMPPTDPVEGVIPRNDGVPPTDSGAAADPRNDGVEGMPPTDPVEGNCSTQ